VLPYFRDKQELFEHAMREANLILRDRVAARMKAATTPYDRLWAVIDENLGHRSFRAPSGAAWLSLCSEAVREPHPARIQKVIHARMHSNLMSALTAMIPRDRAVLLALCISSLIDGLWVRLGIGDTTVSSEMALRMAHLLIGSVLPPEVMRPLDINDRPD
jgi:TetR/AcrR family transcriptional repressor of bet genes